MGFYAAISVKDVCVVDPSDRQPVPSSWLDMTGDHLPWRSRHISTIVSLTVVSSLFVVYIPGSTH